jgi:hypothetical protein
MPATENEQKMLKDSEKSQQSDALNIFKRGIEYLGSSHPSEALSCFGQVYRVVGNVPNLHYARAVALSQVGRAVQARLACETELRNNPGHTPAENLLKEIPQIEIGSKCGLSWPEASYLVNHEYKFVYCPVPKVVCSNLKKAILKIAGFDEIHDHPPNGYSCNVHNNIYECVDIECTFRLNRGEVFRILEGNDYFKFAFVRNPWSRLVSVYLNKIVSNYVGHLARREELIIRIQNRHNLGKDLDKRITFRQFVVYVFEQDDMQLDDHWRPQSCFIGHHNFDFIGKFENIQADLNYVNSKLGVNLEIAHNKNTVGYVQNSIGDAAYTHYADCYCDELKELRKSCGGFPDYRYFYPPDLKELVAKRFKNDIEMFGYDFE